MKFSFTGDALCSPTLVEYVRSHPFDFHFCFDRCREIFARSDFNIANLETPVAGEKFLYTRERYCFNTPLAFAEALRDSGIHAVSTANNHCMDRRTEGLYATLDNLDSIGLLHTGTSRNPRERETCITVNTPDGLKIALMSYTYGTNAFANHHFIPEGEEYCVNLLQPQEELPGSVFPLHMNDYEEIAKQTRSIYGTRDNPQAVRAAMAYLNRADEDIRKAREQGADCIVLLIHTGGQNCPDPDAYSKMLMNHFAPLADVIIGNHPHVPHIAEKIGNTEVFYSLGNLLYYPSGSAQEKELHGQYSIVPLLEIVKNKNGGFDRKITFSVTFCERLENGVSRAVPVRENLPAELLYAENKPKWGELFSR